MVRVTAMRVKKMPSLPLPSTTTTVDNATIGAVGSISLLPPSTTTAIAAADDHYCCCHTVDNNKRQKLLGTSLRDTYVMYPYQESPETRALSSQECPLYIRYLVNTRICM
jgi:hypothetical protein